MLLKFENENSVEESMASVSLHGKLKQTEQLQISDLHEILIQLSECGKSSFAAKQSTRIVDFYYLYF